jgi:hypothetical protein
VSVVESKQVVDIQFEILAQDVTVDNLVLEQARVEPVAVQFLKSLLQMADVLYDLVVPVVVIALL